MLEKGLLGQKSEKFTTNDAQLTLQVLGGVFRRICGLIWPEQRARQQMPRRADALQGKLAPLGAAAPLDRAHPT